MEDEFSKPYNILLFHLPKDEDDPNNFDGKGFSYYVMNELAKHEKFLYDQKDIGFYFIEDVNCMAKFGVTPGSDTAVMFLRKDLPNGESVRLPHLANNFDLNDF